MMKRFLQWFCLFSLLMLHTLFTKAQDFPATKKQVVDWLTASEWKLKFLVVDGRKLNADEINMKASIRFSADSSYTMVFLSEKSQGIYEINMDEKWIRLLNKKTSKEFLISNLRNDEFEAESLGENDGGLIMIFFSLKRNI